MKKPIQKHIPDILELVDAMHPEVLRVYGDSGVEMGFGSLSALGAHLNHRVSEGHLPIETWWVSQPSVVRATCPSTHRSG